MDEPDGPEDMPVPAEAFRLSRDGAQVVLDFGSVEAIPTTAEGSILVSDRVTIPLETARRMLVGLEQAVLPHLEKLRAAEAKALSPASAAVAARPGAGPTRAPPDSSGEKAAQLLRMVGRWGAPHQYERSVRLSASGLQANRYILTLNVSDIPGDALNEVFAVCDAFEMPADPRLAAVERFSTARCVHFGFEGDPDSMVCKLYLERSVPPDELRKAAASGQSVLQHVAYKWDMLRDAAVTTRYLWYPGLGAAGIEARMAHVYRDTPPESFDIARSVLHLALERVAPEAIQFLDVEEDENGRRSFDLNVYNAHLKVKDLHSLLLRMRAHFSIRPGQFQALYDQINALPLGHVAGGTHRDSRDFFNVYYGAVGLPHFNDKLR